MDPELVGPFLKQVSAFVWSLSIFLDASVEVGDSEHPQRTMATKPFGFASNPPVSIEVLLEAWGAGCVFDLREDGLTLSGFESAFYKPRSRPHLAQPYSKIHEGFGMKI